MTTALKFRNISASPDDPVDTWPFEGILAAVERARFRTGVGWPPIRNGRTWHRRSDSSWADPACRSRISRRG
jgi:hypothetical protein